MNRVFGRNVFNIYFEPAITIWPELFIGDLEPVVAARVKINFFEGHFQQRRQARRKAVAFLWPELGLENRLHSILHRRLGPEWILLKILEVVSLSGHHALLEINFFLA